MVAVVVVEVVVVVDEGEGEEVDRDGDRDDDDDGAEVPFVAKRAAHVRSAWGMNVLLPVRSARW